MKQLTQDQGPVQLAAALLEVLKGFQDSEATQGFEGRSPPSGPSKREARVSGDTQAPQEAPLATSD